jgi:hypothetical protein
MLEEKITEETEKTQEAADRPDETFRISQAQWLEYRAHQATLARLILERFPEHDRRGAGLREAAHAILDRHAVETEMA